MASLPTHNIYPRTNNFLESFNSSVSKFPVRTRLQFLRYAYHTIPFKKPSFSAANSSTTDSAPTPQQNPQKRSKFYRVEKSKAMGLAIESPVSKGQAGNMSLSRNSWLDKWNETNKKDKLKGPQPLMDYSGEISCSDSEESSSGSTMDRIVQKLKRFGIVDNTGENKDNADKAFEKGSVEDIFHIEEGILPNPRGGYLEKSPFGDDNVFSRNGEVRFPWEKPEVSAEEEGYSVRQKSRTSLSELTLPESEINRLKRLTFKLKNKTKIGGAGVTHEIVEKIHEKWKASEVVRLKIEGAPALNMKRMHEILERKTGGLVVWRSGTSVSLYRGVGYKFQSEALQKRTYNKNHVPPDHLSLIASDISSDKLTEISETKANNDQFAPQVEPATDGTGSTEIESTPEVKYEDEIENLLDSLGPRYTDWPGPGPLPVDADLLPGHLPGYKPPFRILPYGVRSTLGTKEATALRRLARVIPPHFALGRSRQHQGLAAAMIKLWERSSIAKIALKRGVQLTTSERMAEDIKKLTGCIMLSRNKDFLVFYRGKNFLSPEVAEVLMEKESLAKALQDEEEQARLRACALVTQDAAVREESGTAGTLGETLDADAKWGKRLDDEHKKKVMRDADMLRHANLVRRLERKLTFVERKIVKAERALSKVEQSLNPAESVANEGSITDEERFMFRKLGLKMKAFLLLGRRGVFDGTVENMHLHWKYRELVKIMVKAKNIEQVKSIALSLEAESGGVLVSVDKVSKGYAIIVFRGKDYRRPSVLRPKNLLTKRKALARSIELQRHEALVRHISTLQARVDQLRSEIDEMAEVKGHGDEELYNRIDSAYPAEDEESEEEADHGDEELYSRMDSSYSIENEEGGNHGDDELYDRIASAYPTDDEESEEEEDDAYPEIYDSEDPPDENDGMISNHHLQVDDDLLDESEEYTNNHHQLNFSDVSEGASEIRPELS